MRFSQLFSIFENIHPPPLSPLRAATVQMEHENYVK